MSIASSTPRLALVIATLLAAPGCERAAPHVEPEPRTEAPHASDTAPSASAPRSGSASARTAAVVEREDIPLGKPCSFRLARPDPSKPAFWDMIDPAWEASKSQRVVTCHVRLSPKVHAFDVEIVTAPGSNHVERLTIRPAGDTNPVGSFEGSLTIANWMSIQIDATDLNFDGVKDLVMPRSYGTSGCHSYHYIVYVPPTATQPERFVDTAIQETCNPYVDPKRRLVITDMDDAEGIARWRWNGADFVRVR